MRRAVFWPRVRAGCGVAQSITPGERRREYEPQIVDLPELMGDVLEPASSSGFRSKIFASADGMSISVQVGNLPQHLHPKTSEMQNIVEGTGTIWLGEKEVRVQPGDLMIIPKGAPLATRS
jgi:mannose-6-phosphate isomerase-like protein (cupin superfamily)